jgi:hypothetical protein
VSTSHRVASGRGTAGFLSGRGTRRWLIGELRGQPFYLHPGDNPGYVSLNAIIPNAHARVILLANDETTDIFTPAMEFLEAVLD